MSYDFPRQPALALLMAVALLTVVTTILAMYMLLVQIELQATLTFDDAEEDVELEENDEDDYVNAAGVTEKSNKDTTKPKGSGETEEGVARRLHLPNYRRAALAGIVVIVTFMAYLLLALSNANFILSWIGMAIILGLLMRPTIFEEVRRDRFDRLSCLVSLLLVLAMSLNLMVYANNQHAQGDIYEGKARIVGYDYSSYEQDKDQDTILRSDLEVAWGGTWGCPNVPDQACQTFVNGALCETEETYVDVDAEGGNRRQQRKQRQLWHPLPTSARRRRLFQKQQRSEHQEKQMAESEIKQMHSAEDQVYGQIQQGNQAYYQNQYTTQLERQSEEEEIEEEYAEEVENEDNGADTEEKVQEEDKNTDTATTQEESYEDLEKEKEDLEKEKEDLEAENEELKEEEGELEEELGEYEDYVEDEDEEIEELEEGYYFDDDDYDDEYWQETTWDSVWGEYACEDLFDQDLSGQSFDETKPPGSDEWPFVNIYGNCDTCEAYIVDFYSTQHFQSILKYKNAGLAYGILAGLSLLVTSYLIVKEVEKKRTTEKEIELLSSPQATGGALA
mmetsp:Transcript_1446/g.1978  ORF Transcript_1446/g.1978 Transcript_1446/m.1978 type:complete len:562 (+) Transcript_1446:343-2028(+)|eukprot:CAMPEP_0198143418 /NCGR_PEP_ID=MMETSP1443-20131203/7377_1 /TAXON_ID=186043 /ORGANISM="Entomoneis sp., Strain CCMP2396" /LENGTH=561 /DNA_ID=CAMNT_0043806653 /DNA_START=253 /DNA_END=1938 /DNA_ORIENTATION=+